MSSFKEIRAQGREAKKVNDGNTAADGGVIDTSIKMFTAHDCPYGPGDARDAWLAGFGGAEEPVEQVDTSEANIQDVRTETADAVREGGKTDDPDATKVVTDLTGTAETSLVTKVVPQNPEASEIVPTPETIVGDPAASQKPTDANVMRPSDETGDTAKPKAPVRKPKAPVRKPKAAK